MLKIMKIGFANILSKIKAISEIAPIITSQNVM